MADEKDKPETAPPGDAPPATWDEIFKHPRFRELNQRAKDAETKLATLEEKGKKAAEKELAEQQKWQQLAEQRDAELKAERLARLRLQVAAKKGLPADFAGRLQGEDEKALEADAENLLQFVKPATPGVPPKGGNGSPQPGITPEQLNNPQWIRENSEKVWDAIRKGQV